MEIFIGKLLWQIYPLQGGDREIGDYAAAVARQRPANNNTGMVFFCAVRQAVNSNRGTVFYVRSMP
jgi:hypothetical protein